MLINKKVLIAILSTTILFVVSACSPTRENITTDSDLGQIYLYGESHGKKEVLEKEFELWYNFYNQQNMRHLFIEYPYYTAEFLNIWMQSDNDNILEEIYADWKGTQSQVQEIKDFYKKIKIQCPETIFHGTDIGHQYDSTGKRYLQFLKNNSLGNMEKYKITEEVIEQGKHYYLKSDHVYRENKMTENFIREFNQLSGESIMGIYGAAHTGLDGMEYYTNAVPSMANQLKKHFANIFSEDLSYLEKDIKPYRVDSINIAGKEYDASYFGKQDLTTFTEEYSYREFWRLESAYNDVKNFPKTQEVLPYNNFPMLIEQEQVFVIDYIKKDQSVERKYYRSDGRLWENQPVTEAFEIK